MGYVAGAIKWPIGMLLTPWGFFSLYVFGDSIWNTVVHFQAVLAALSSESPDQLLRGLINVYVPMPAEIVGSLILYPLVGGTVGALLWFLGSTT